MKKKRPARMDGGFDKIVANVSNVNNDIQVIGIKSLKMIGIWSHLIQNYGIQKVASQK